MKIKSIIILILLSSLNICYGQSIYDAVVNKVDDFLYKQLPLDLVFNRVRVRYSFQTNV